MIGMGHRPGPERRRWPRRIPKSLVHISLESGHGPAHRGLVANICEGGACVSSPGAFSPGDEVVLWLTFHQHPQPLPATARVCWSLPASQGSHRLGLEWTHAGPHRARLEMLVAAVCDEPALVEGGPQG